MTDGDPHPCPGWATALSLCLMSPRSLLSFLTQAAAASVSLLVASVLISSGTTSSSFYAFCPSPPDPQLSQAAPNPYHHPTPHPQRDRPIPYFQLWCSHCRLSSKCFYLHEPPLDLAPGLSLLSG